MQIRIKKNTSSYAVYNNNDLGYNVDYELNGKYACGVLGITIYIPKEDCEIVQEEPIKPILKPFTFEEWDKDRSQPVYTTSGIKVTQLTYFENLNKGIDPFVGVIKNSTYGFNKEGNGSYTLMLESKEKEYYVNVYRDAEGCLYMGLVGAKEYCLSKHGAHNYITTISFKC